jgi:glycosyltransferase involved in cell wall biosynthesis
VRVCFLIDELAKAGTETQLLALIRHLERRRVEPFLVLLRGDSEQSRALEPDCCPVLRLGVSSLHSPATLLRAFRFARFLKQMRIDVVQVYFPDSSYFGVPVAWLAGVRHRIRTRNNIGHWLTPLHRRLGRALNFLTTATIANCAAASQALLHDERPRPDSVFVLENGVDLERFLSLPVPTPRAPACVGTVANLRAVKGLDVLVEAGALLTRVRPKLSFQVAGTGDQHAALTQQIHNAGLVGRFTLRGPVTDVPSFLEGLDIAVLPSRAEGMSNAVLEYMAAGRPIVATAVGATAELLDEGTCGLLVPPDNPTALAGAIDRLLRNPGLAQRLGEAARRRAREHYSRAAMVRRFEDFYTSLTERQ